MERIRKCAIGANGVALAVRLAQVARGRRRALHACPCRLPSRDNACDSGAGHAGSGGHGATSSSGRSAPRRVFFVADCPRARPPQAVVVGWSSRRAYAVDRATSWQDAAPPPIGANLLGGCRVRSTATVCRAVDATREASRAALPLAATLGGGGATLPTRAAAFGHCAARARRAMRSRLVRQASRADLRSVLILAVRAPCTHLGGRGGPTRQRKRREPGVGATGIVTSRPTSWRGRPDEDASSAGGRARPAGERSPQAASANDAGT